MNIENTNTPNGDSNNLYILNDDNVEINFLALEERDPSREDGGISDEAGSNSSVVPIEIGTINNEQIQKVGFVGIPVISKNRDEYEKIKGKIKAKAEMSKEIKEKNKVEIDDRNK